MRVLIVSTDTETGEPDESIVDLPAFDICSICQSFEQIDTEESGEPASYKALFWSYDRGPGSAVFVIRHAGLGHMVFGMAHTAFLRPDLEG